MSSKIKFSYQPGKDPYTGLSPWFGAPFFLEEDGDRILFQSVQHYLSFKMCKDETYRKKILGAWGAKDANFWSSKSGMAKLEVKLSSSFLDKKEKYYERAYTAIHEQNEWFRELLKSTDDAKLVFDSPYDDVMGVGKKGDGKNKLGKFLMTLRDG